MRQHFFVLIFIICIFSEAHGQVKISEKKKMSFVPDEFVRSKNDDWKNITSSKVFSVLYSKESGQVIILNSKQDTVISSLSLYTEWMTGGNENKHLWEYHFYFIKDSVSEKGNYIKLSAHNDISENEILILAGTQGELTFNVSTVFLKQVILYRHSIVAGYSLPLSEVYKKSTLTDTLNFKEEYWLDKEGFKLSNVTSTYVLYRPEKISSVQLDVKNKLMIFNIDYYSDHPFRHFPVTTKDENRYVDYSTAVIRKKDIMQSVFTFYPTIQQVSVAKFMTNPYGYLSSFIWTEHADYTDIRTHKAVYYGSEKISRPDSATGGFIRYSIPVTKGIFYNNPERTDNSEKAGFMNGPVATLKETPGFRNFLKQLEESGIEICLNTPDPLTCNKKNLEEALEITRREFAPVTWIDHGYDNSIRSNREDISCDGADSTSKWYAADLWRKYGLKYFWSNYFGEVNIVNANNFNSFFLAPNPGGDDAVPTPVYWRHKTRTGELIHWRTTNNLEPNDGSFWSNYFNDLRLSDIVKNRDNIIALCYPARVDSTNGFYIMKDGIVEVNDDFNHALEKLSFYRKQEKIRLTTIREMLDYRTSVEKITYEIFPDGMIHLFNSGNEKINGLSFSANANEVVCDQKDIKKKRAGDELVFWFDMSPGENVTFRIY